MRCPYCRESNAFFKNLCARCGQDLTRKRATVQLVGLGVLLALLATVGFKSCADSLDRPPAPTYQGE